MLWQVLAAKRKNVDTAGIVRTCQNLGELGKKKQSCLGRGCTVMIPEDVVHEPLKKVRMRCMDAYRYTVAKCSYKVCTIMFFTSNTQAKHSSFM